MSVKASSVSLVRDGVEHVGQADGDGVRTVVAVQGGGIGDVALAPAPPERDAEGLNLPLHVVPGVQLRRLGQAHVHAGEGLPAVLVGEEVVDVVEAARLEGVDVRAGEEVEKRLAPLVP